MQVENLKGSLKMKAGSLVKELVYTQSDGGSVFRYGLVMPMDKFLASNIKTEDFTYVLWQPSKARGFITYRGGPQLIQTKNLTIVNSTEESYSME